MLRLVSPFRAFDGQFDHFPSAALDALHSDRDLFELGGCRRLFAKNGPSPSGGRLVVFYPLAREFIPSEHRLVSDRDLILYLIGEHPTPQHTAEAIEGFGPDRTRFRELGDKDSIYGFFSLRIGYPPIERTKLYLAIVKSGGANAYFADLQDSRDEALIGPVVDYLKAIPAEKRTADALIQALENMPR